MPSEFQPKCVYFLVADLNRKYMHIISFKYTENKTPMTCSFEDLKQI